MSQPLCSPKSPKDDTKEEDSTRPDQNAPVSIIEYRSCDVSLLTSPEPELWGGVMPAFSSSPATELRDHDIWSTPSILSSRTIALRDHDIICSNGGITDHDQDNHPGNVQMKEIIKAFVRKWNEFDPDHRDETLENIFLEQIKSQIDAQDGRPSFLIRNADDTQWGRASHQVIHDEILGEWWHQKDTFQPVNDRNVEKTINGYENDNQDNEQPTSTTTTTTQPPGREHKIYKIIFAVVVVIIVAGFIFRLVVANI